MLRASIISALESISLLKEEQRASLNVPLDGEDVFLLLSTGFGKSLIVIWFVNLTG